MKMISNKIWLMAVCMWLSACSEQTDVPSDDDMSQSSVELVASRAAEGDFNFKAHMNRLYIGERKQEHGEGELHLHSASDLYSMDGVSLSFRETQMKPAWYKFVMISAPKIVPGTDDYANRTENFKIFTEEIPEAGSCDLNSYLINYEPILKMKPGSEAPDVKCHDGDVFRGIVNCWLKNGVNTKENFNLKRINGLLVVDMGILADQFDGKVTSVTLAIDKTPSQVYVTDDNQGKVKCINPINVEYHTTPDDMEKVAEKDRRHHKIIVNLLPSRLNGSIKVTTEKGGNYEFELTPVDEVLIKPNTRTLLTFNGIEQGYFKTEYAGYDNTGFDIDDSWNGGWNVNNGKGK